MDLKILAGLLSLLPMALSSLPVYTNTYAVKIEGGIDQAHRVAKRHGFINLGEIVPGHYHFEDAKHLTKRSFSKHTERHQHLENEAEVVWFEQQTIKSRSKRRSDLAYPAELDSHLNDPKWPIWYLDRGPGLDMNVLPAWSNGYTGKGVVVSILDDGIEKNHPDLKDNYDPEASWDVNDNDDNPQPRYDWSNENRHGTRCAGEVAAQANNSICSVGVAFKASIGGVRMLDGDVTDAVEARSLSHNPQHVDIYSASWGPDDDGKTVDGPGSLAKKAFFEGVTRGRAGLGSIFVWASGNGGRSGDSCGCDGYTNSIFTISVSSVSEKGVVPWYSERCSSTLATTYSSGAGSEKQVVTTDLRQECTDRHSGTSASAPLAAGICALALEANPTLTWRDLQHIIVMTARSDNLKVDDWVKNGAGYLVSHSYGFGLMDASGMVNLAKTWQRIPNQHKCSYTVVSSPQKISPDHKLTVSHTSTGCIGSSNNIQHLEHVVAKLSISFSKRGDLKIALISPSGTKSTLLPVRSHDYTSEKLDQWEFMTTHNWGERPQGLWTLEVENMGRSSNRGQLEEWTLELYGTEVHPLEKHSGPQECHMGEHLATNVTLNGTIQHSCQPCHPTCETCIGSEASDCIECRYNFQKRDTLCITMSISIFQMSSGISVMILFGALCFILVLIFILGLLFRSTIIFRPLKGNQRQEYNKLLADEDSDMDDVHFAKQVNEYRDEPSVMNSHSLPVTQTISSPLPPPSLLTQNQEESSVHDNISEPLV